MEFIHKAARSQFSRYVPRVLRSGVKRVLKQTGIFDEFKARVGLDAVYEDDVFITSYPKSGNTWVRFLLANMLNPKEQITFRNIESYVPFLDWSREQINRMRSRRFIKTHEAAFEFFPRFIYVYRDGRDALVSYYHYSQQKGWYQGTFSDFLRTEIPYWNGHWHEHVSAAMDYAQLHPKQVLLIQYEQMLREPMKCAARIADFCQLDVDQQMIQQAVRRSEFRHLREVEQQHGTEVEGTKVQFFRCGKSNQWPDYFSQTDLEEFLALAGPTLRRLNYDDCSSVRKVG